MKIFLARMKDYISNLYDIIATLCACYDSVHNNVPINDKIRVRKNYDYVFNLKLAKLIIEILNFINLTKNIN